MLKRLQQNLDTKYDLKTKIGVANLEKAQQQSRHLNEQLGLMKYGPADKTLRRLIPTMDSNRQIDDDVVRATAMWALGLIHEDKPDPELTSLLMARLNALESLFNPEPDIVGEAAAYGVGWMRDPGGLKTLRHFAARSGMERNAAGASAWAVMRITGKPLPLGEPHALPMHQWFLQPAE